MTFSGILSAALPTADTSQTNHCRGLVAETKTSGTGLYIVGTYVSVQIGPIGQKEWYDFFDEDNWGSTYYQANAYSRAGCESCFLDHEYRYSRLAISEHFWQEHEYPVFAEYCPHSQTFGTWNPGDYCEALTQEHAGCTPI